MSNYLTDSNLTDSNLSELNSNIINQVTNEGKPIIVTGSKDLIGKIAVLLGLNDIRYYPSPELGKKEIIEHAKLLRLERECLYVSNNIEYLESLVLNNESDFNIIRAEQYNYCLALKLFSKKEAKELVVNGIDIR